jgi:pyrroline-5-carboxylate reductase
MLSDIRIAFIGAGAMGEAIISRLLHHRVVLPDQIMAAEPRPERRTELQSRYSISLSEDTLHVARWGKIVLLAVKPQIIQVILPSLRVGLQKDTLCISIAAGVSLHTLATLLHHTAIVRAMPNTPAQIGEGMTVWTALPEVTHQQREWTKTILASLGQELYVEHEQQLDMATAINGSGPAYVFLILESMIDAAVHLGFTRPIAEQLVYQTMLGSVQYAIQSDLHLAQLRNNVTSPAGTTAAAVNALERGNLRTTLSDAIWAAYHRSCELGRKE